MRRARAAARAARRSGGWRLRWPARRRTFREQGGQDGRAEREAREARRRGQGPGERHGRRAAKEQQANARVVETQASSTAMRRSPAVQKPSRSSRASARPDQRARRSRELKGSEGTFGDVPSVRRFEHVCWRPRRRHFSARVRKPFIDLLHAPLEESSMIPPSLLSTNFLFTLIPIWEPAPAPNRAVLRQPTTPPTRLAKPARHRALNPTGMPTAHPGGIAHGIQGVSGWAQAGLAGRAFAGYELWKAVPTTMKTDSVRTSVRERRCV